MKKTLLVAAIAALVPIAGAGAQDLVNSPCPRGTSDSKGIPDATRIAQDGCQQAYDIYQFVSPELGLLLAGGGAILGTGNTLGGLGHFSLGLRVNAMHGSYPDIANIKQNVTGVQRQMLQTKDTILPLPTADASIGLFNGFEAGATHVGGVDLLASIAYVPSLTIGDFSLKPSTNWQIGYGVRVGLLEESMLAPGLSLTYLKRDLPETDLIATTGGTTLSVLKAKVQTSAWRVSVSKTFFLFGIAAGAGQDTYDQSAAISATVTQDQYTGSTTVPKTEQSLTRMNYFTDASINLPIFKIVAEVGNVSGGIVETYNSFSRGRADRSQSYASFGIRLSW